MCLQKTVKREPKIGKECIDVSEPKLNVYGEKYPVRYSIQVGDNANLIMMITIMITNDININI